MGTKRAALYARVSSDDRGQDGRNLTSQLDMCREYAKENGWHVVAELAEDDRGARGADINLPNLTKARDMAAAGDIDVLVVREIDRLSRRLAKQLIVEREFQNAGVLVEYVLGDYPDSPEGRLNKHIRATVAEFEAEKIAEHLTRGRRNKVKAGHVVVHGRPPYGYALGDVGGKRALVIHEPEAAIVRQIFEWYTVGNGAQRPLTLFDIGQRLTDLGVLTKADTDARQYKLRGRGKWNRRVIHKILRREAYCGVWYYGKTRTVKKKQIENPRENWIPVDVPAIVSRDTWQAAQGQLNQNQTQKAGRKAEIKYLVQRRARCADCGKAMSAVAKYQTKCGASSYYYCPATKHADFARVCESRGYWRTDQVDAAIWEWLHDLLADPRAVVEGMRKEQASRAATVKPLAARLATIDALIAENKTKLGRSLDAYIDGHGDDLLAMLKERAAQYEKLIGNLQAERAELASRLAGQDITDEQIESVVEYTRTLAGWLEEAGQDFAIQRQLVERIGLTAELEIRGEERIIHLHCDAGSGPVPLLTPSTSTCLCSQ